MNELNINIKSFKFEKQNEHFFSNIIINLKENDLNFLIGMSGIGKTTLLNIILGVYTKNIISQIQFQYGNNNYSCTEAQRLGLIGLISQTPSLVPWETIGTNLNIPYKLNRRLKKPTKNEIEIELGSVGLDKKILNLFPHQLSFGMQSRVAIVRTLLYEPKFLFLDELFTGIDTINSELIAKKLSRYIKENNVISLSITHDIDRAMMIASNIFLINSNQKIIELDNPFNKTEIINLIDKNLN
ncbi:MAG: ATP-binding cassette domain-containing protein [Aequorivita antarctica]